MLKICNITLPYLHDEKALLLAAARALHVEPDEITALHVVRKSYDCRKKPRITAVYTVTVSCRHEDKLLPGIRRLPNVSRFRETQFRLLCSGTKPLHYRPVIVGSGPAGLFCALELSRAGYRPVIIERGKTARERQADVARFHSEGILDPESNVQFGEGGAGTFSDGKLTTGVKDKDGRCRKVLTEFVHFGADPDILVSARPHIGTDVLIRILEGMRRQIEEAGGTFRFGVRLDDILQADGETLTLRLSDGTRLQTQCAVLAIGNGAQDTFRMLYQRGIVIEQKPFAVGMRIEHPQQLIDHNAYGEEADRGLLPPASYKLTAQTGGRGVYSFCMCPGGYVINASSSPGQTVVNGMSFRARDGRNANAAIVMTVTGADFGSAHPLAGLEYQKALEKRAFSLCGGRIPQQRLEDFKNARCSSGYGSVIPAAKGRTGLADLGQLWSPDMKDAFLDAFDRFEQRIRGFSDPDAILSAAETRTSSPIRIPRNEKGISTCAQLYPCGEGAGYAGGICSAAMDGLKTAQQIAATFRPDAPAG